MERKPGRLFRAFLVVVLVGIFFELATLIGFLSDGDRRTGNIAVVDIKGEIGDPQAILDDLKKNLESENVKAIVLRIDSPGGAVGSSQEIHDMVLTALKTKKVVASLGNVAASGGYYVAAPATKIIANAGTITGSIGVIAQFFVIEDLLKKAYLRWDVIKAGKMKDIGSPLRTMTDPERKMLQSMTDDIHLQFMEAVSLGRKMPLEKVKTLADGSIYSGRQAQKLGLVDDLGGLEKAIDVAAKLARIEGKPKVIWPEKEHFGWLKKFAEEKFGFSTLQVNYRLVP